ncbi:unnamed protein product [Allacma fusca]|uniref:Uncharacterized protein n=1 Tax=Allacma fusca TaxID=39272 RepID=A0A8J2LR24_9HEXA|nr:unnamed protein product [Allacma fusca]
MRPPCGQSRYRHIPIEDLFCFFPIRQSFVKNVFINQERKLEVRRRSGWGFWICSATVHVTLPIRVLVFFQVYGLGGAACQHLTLYLTVTDSQQ